MAKEQRLEQHIETIARWIIEYKHIVAFMGAGISTDSGIPDFRGPATGFGRGAMLGSQLRSGGFRRAKSSPMPPTWPSSSSSGFTSSSSSLRKTLIISIVSPASAPSCSPSCTATGNCYAASAATGCTLDRRWSRIHTSGGGAIVPRNRWQGSQCVPPAVVGSSRPW